jgi:hypothetical protein
MPFRMDISRLDRVVIIVAHGHITPDEIASTIQTLAEAKVADFGKIVDISQAKSDLTHEQVEKVAALLRGPPGDTPRGPVAFVINPDRTGVAADFADVTQAERPISLFRSIHQARAWLQTTRKDPQMRSARKDQARQPSDR